jgi:putative tricarboxylic transport membrane protein
MQNKRDMITGFLLILIGIGVVIHSIGLQVGTVLRPLPGFFPFLVGLAVIVLSLILLVQGWSGRGKALQPMRNLLRPAIMVVCMGVYATILDPLGYVPSTIFIAAITLRIMGVRSWKVISLSSSTLSVGVYLLFTRMLGVELPAGIFPFLG